MISLDVETTGADPQEARIVQACVVFVGGGAATDSLCLVADPGVEVPDEAAAIHGFTTERVREEGHPAADVVGAIISLLAAGLGGDGSQPLVVFNARYDLTVLDREARRYGLVPLQERVPVMVVDPLVIDKHLDRYRKGSRKLSALCELLGIDLTDAHDASADALAAARCAWKLGAAGQIVRRVRSDREQAEFNGLVREWEHVRADLPLLHAAQERWAEYERERFAAYKREQGEPDVADSIERERWPWTPVGERVQESAAA